MDDRWEMHYFGALDQSGDGDFDGDGISNLQEYLRGTDPLDYFNGVVPVIEIVSGNNQIADSGTFLAQPLSVRIRNTAGELLVNAPITFSGGGSFSADGDSEWVVQWTLMVRSDANGLAEVYYQTPFFDDLEIESITVQAQSGSSVATAEFTATTDPKLYYDGITPVLTIISGADQSAVPGYYTSAPLVVEVRDSAGNLLRNAPVTLSTASGYLNLSRDTNSGGSATLLARTDANGRVMAYYMPTSGSGPSQITIAPTGAAPGDGVSATGKALDPAGDEDNDGKTNEDEAKLGTNPSVFNLFSETHYSGHVETPHTENDPLPWVFYTETLTGAPEAWEGMTVKAAVVFDSGGTENNWVVDDYASINGQQFVALGYDLIYDVSDKWNATETNTLTATSDITGGVFCAAYKVILSVEVKVDIQIERLAGGTGFLPEETVNALNENAPGAQVLRNNDDDDMNGQSDSFDTGRVVQPENDMNRLGLSVSSGLKKGKVRLRIESSVGGISLKIWKDLNNKVIENQLLSGGVSPVEKEWDLADEGKRQEFATLCTTALWVEASGSDSSNQVTGLIKLIYEPTEGPQNNDHVKVSVPPGKRYTLTIAQNSASPDSALAELIHDSEEVLRRDDDGDQGTEDRQCAIGFAKGLVTADNTSSLASINFDDDQQVDAVYDRMSQLGVNTYITGNVTGGRDLLGFARIGSGRIVIKANTGDQSLIAHEWGHALGLDHRDTAPNAVMYRSGGTMVNEAEANIFLGQ